MTAVARRRGRRIAIAIGVAIGAIVAAWFLIPHASRPRGDVATSDAARTAMDAADPVRGQDSIARGRYLAAAGDCIGCHQARGGEPFAGGLAVPTPFGRFYAPNITPDRETGIGAWTADDFWQALHHGKGKDGSLLYPAFPYPNYTRITRADSDAMYAFLMAQPAVRRPNTPHALRFPYSIRPLLVFWRTRYFREETFEPDASKSPEWNRGAYLATGLGHCVACHSPRDGFGGTAEADELSGGLIPEQNWYAPSLTSHREAGLGDWPVDDVVAFLKDGVNERHAVFGPMAEVVHDSTQHLDPRDLRAMAVYLKSLPAKASDDAPPVRTTATMQAELGERGARLYDEHCAACHQASGEGIARAYPALARNPGVIMDSTINAIRVVLNGGFPPSTAGNPQPFGMPPFAHVLSDEDIAAVLTHVRTSWGNRAPAVSPADVARYRSVPIE